MQPSEAEMQGYSSRRVPFLHSTSSNRRTNLKTHLLAQVDNHGCAIDYCTRPRVDYACQYSCVRLAGSLKRAKISLGGTDGLSDILSVLIVANSSLV